MNRAVSVTMLAVAVGATSGERESVLPGPSNDNHVRYRPPTATALGRGSAGGTQR
ncbi:hypothetical protein HQ602_16595 [Rhodococcus kroppenstedtii]|uniref:hypothetical protein n=1 Tax=Rhodococcoides kroppenstedtii TaxID=293050 RepID=UPI001C9B6A51|nr:hypothetical protein [Rhodococcus kroppenstedtii]MBY6438001.1 hypothetical protein [Rhodococcus kroppenstedtii]